MSNRIKNNLKNLVGQTLNQYYSKVKPTISDLRYKQEYQNRIIECMVGEVDDNYITTPETDNPIVKLEHSKEGVIKIPQIKGKTILIDADGNETDTPGEGCRLVSVGEEEDNKLIILSKNKNLFPYSNISIDAKTNQTWYSLEGNVGMYGNDMWSKTKTWIYLPRGYIKVTTQELFNCGIQMVTPNEKIIPYNGNSLFEGGYVTFRLRNNDTVNKFGYKNLMFEWSQSPILNNSNYIESKQHKTEILLDEPLRKLPNGVCDKIINNHLIRRVGKMVLNGSENWERMHYPPSENGTHIQFSIQNHFENKNVKGGFWVDKNLFICDIFPRADERLHWIGTGSIGVGGDDMTFMFTLSKNHELYTIIKDVSELKEWLSNNPITVLYELEEPIIEELPNSVNLQGFDDTTMYIENSITPTVSYGYNALIPYKEELSKQKEEVETNTLDIENNIIPYLMDMEFNLMLMEDN